MNIKDLRNRMISDLSGIYPEQESANMVHWLFSSVLKVEKSEFSLFPEKEISGIQEKVLMDKFSDLLHHKPIQYITGTAYFYGLELDVNPSVLIPRPETEELVKWIAGDHYGRKNLRILDIGTGSGCIILALGTLLPDQLLNATDNSSFALQVATANAKKLGINVIFTENDILDRKQWEQFGEFDIIVSNPPYVSLSEQNAMQKNVLEYEPHGALFVPDSDALLFYRAIADFAKKKLAGGGRLYVEINEAQGPSTMGLFRKKGFRQIEIKQDLQRKDRMISACI